MNVLLIGSGAIISAFLMSAGITCMKKIDNKHGLPENVGVFYILVTAIAGGITTEAFYPYFFLSIFFTAYLAIMAYTDFYTMKLYTIFHIIAALTGYIALFHFKWSIWEFTLGFGLIFFMQLAKVISIGDVELLFASFPYCCIFAQIYKIDELYFYFIFLIVIMVISIIINFKAFIKKGKTKAPFAVPMFIGYVAIALFMIRTK